MRALGLTTVFVVVGSGCQVITGSYTVQTVGPVCAGLIVCCASLDVAESQVCLPAITSGDENLCAAVRTTLPPNACTLGVTSDAGILFLDGAQGHPDAVARQDVLAPHDAASPPVVTGTWTLTSLTCEGQGLTLNGTTTFSIATSSAQEVESLTDGCVVTENLAPVSISDTAITSTAGTVGCGASCSAAECSAGSTGSVNLPYTLSGGTLNISETVPTTTCASGTLLFTFTK